MCCPGHWPSSGGRYVHYYLFEAPDADIRSVLSKFGQIKGLRYQSFPGYSNVKTGSRIVRMVVEREIPSQQSIRGYLCRVWYKGQPIRCNICREVGHLAASYPNKGLCRRCKEHGHTAGQCTKAWNTDQVSVLAVAGHLGLGSPRLRPLPVRSAAPFASALLRLVYRIRSRRPKCFSRKLWILRRLPPM